MEGLLNAEQGNHCMSAKTAEQVLKSWCLHRVNITCSKRSPTMWA